LHLQCNVLLPVASARVLTGRTFLPASVISHSED
jgi:hypothetical protein